MYLIILMIITVFVLFYLNYIDGNYTHHSRHNYISGLSNPGYINLTPQCLNNPNPNRQLTSKIVMLEYKKGDDLKYWEQVKPLLADDVKIEVKETTDAYKADPNFVYPVISFVDTNLMNVEPPVSISINTNRNFNHIKDRVLSLGPKWNQMV